MIDYYNQINGYTVGGEIQDRLKNIASDPKSLLKSISRGHSLASVENDEAVAANTEMTDLLTEAVTNMTASLGTLDTDVQGKIVAWCTKAAEAALAAATDSVIDDLVTNFTTRTDARYKRRLAEFGAGMHEINSVSGSPFIIGAAMINNERSQEIAAFDAEKTFTVFNAALVQAFQAMNVLAEAELKLFASNYQARMDNWKANRVMRGQHLIDAVNQTISGNNAMQAQWANYVLYKAQATQQHYIMNKEYTETNIDIAQQKEKWTLSLFQSGANVLAGISGAVALPDKPSKAQTAISGALGGAAIGAQVGGPIGAAIGGTLGFIGGLIG